MGPNHKDDCTGGEWTYSGTGYNRVRLCHCGAEDHDPKTTKDMGARLETDRQYLVTIRIDTDCAEEIEHFFDATKEEIFLDVSQLSRQNHVVIDWEEI